MSGAEEADRDPVRQGAARRVGQTIRGKFHLDALLGVGGMASVYAATHRNGSRVALKILHDHVSGSPDVRRLFRREALAANRIEHSGVVRIIDDDVAEDGSAFLVMPLLVGETLQARWERQGKRLSVREALIVGYAVLDTLAAAHAQGIVHRDIKPDNLFITSEGDVRVLDFGVARLLEQSGAAATRAGHAIGTPAFMPPEQALGRVSEVDGQSDVWAVGATLFTCLTGQYVHGAHGVGELLVYAATRPAPALSNASPEMDERLGALVDKALAFRKEDRWGSAASMRDALGTMFEAVLGEPMVESPQVEAPPVEATTRVSVRKEHADVHSDATGTADVASQFPRAPTAIDGGSPSTAEGPAGENDAIQTTRTAVVASVGGRKRLSAPRVVSLCIVGAAAIAGLMLGPRFLRARPAAHSTPRNSDAATHYLAGLQAWEDAAFDTASEEFETAARIDPTLAGAHLRCVLGEFWLNDSTREHYRQALRFRQQLDPADAALLDAYEPMLHEIPDIPGAIAKLDAASHRDESLFALHVLAVVQLQAGRFDDANATVERMLALVPGSPIAFATRGIAGTLNGKVEQTTVELEKCVDGAPRATSCWYTLLRLELSAGKCLDAERFAHRALALGTGGQSFERGLAQAIYGLGGPIEAVRSALDQWQSSDPDSPPAIRDDSSLWILQGNVAESLGAMDRWEKSVEDSKYAKIHMWPAYRKGLFLAELGRSGEATAEAESYLRHRDAWLPGDYADDWFNLVRVEYLSGTISKPDLIAKRSEWLRAESRRSNAVFARAYQWMKAYAFAVVTPADAVEALSALDLFSPLPPSSALSADQNDGIGNVYLKAGMPREAIPYLQRATKACAAIDWPIEQTWASLHLGMALQATGDVPGACDAYASVLSRWGRMPSKSAAYAREQAAVLRCAAPH